MTSTFKKYLAGLLIWALALVMITSVALTTESAEVRKILYFIGLITIIAFPAIAIVEFFTKRIGVKNEELSKD